MDGVDQLARDAATRAIAMIEAHERVCTERARESQTWRESTSRQLDSMFSDLKEDLEAVSKSVGGVYSRIWVAATSIIVLLLGVCGYLIHNHGL